jgi:hypothetical protein
LKGSAAVILAEQALQVVALGKTLHVCRVLRPAEYIKVELNGLAEAGYGPLRRNGADVTGGRPARRCDMGCHV